MVARRETVPAPAATMSFLLFFAFLVAPSQGGCKFPSEWFGRWFQSGVPTPLLINATHIETKGECFEEQGDTKYIVYDKVEDCYRCMAVHSMHESVLQYKETYCESKSSFSEICSGITGDAALYSMFRKSPDSKPVPCPFKSAPFTFTYNRGPGECTNPPSKAESCTDDSRLVLKYQACPDVPSTESFVEELVCLATWKEGSTRYLVGKVSQGNRRSLTDEDQYRCFIYRKETHGNKMVYLIAQSGDATCSGLQSPTEGSRTMILTTVDNHHNRCRFPIWITNHHTWLSLDHKKIYKFSQGNATLKIVDEEPKPSRTHHNYAPNQFGFQELGFQSQDHRRGNTEERLVCHSILQSQEQKKVQIVAHVTAGCNSGYVCMVFYKRDSNVIEMQQSEQFVENPDDACQDFDPNDLHYTTLTTTALHAKKCPRLGRYTISNQLSEARRKRRQQIDGDPDTSNSNLCVSDDYDSLAVGCSGSGDAMEFRSTCSQKSTEYTCHGSWLENGTYYVITSPTNTRKSTENSRYCFMYTATDPPIPRLNDAQNGPARNVGTPILRFSSVTESCNRKIIPGATGSRFYNFTTNGTCESSSTDSTSLVLPSLTIVAILVAVTLFSR